jgi:thiosulfate/3-mercaptopyruvate sulfurtransferase
MGARIYVRDLAERIQSDDRPTLLDVRPSAESNGWPLRDGVSGRVPGAAQFPASWLEDPSGDEVRSRLAGAGAEPTGSVVVCGHDTAEGEASARLLERLGYTDVAVLDGGIQAWVEDPERPVERLARWQHLVPPVWLADVLAGATVPAPPSGRPVVLHVAFHNRADYEAGHVPGARFLDTEELEEPERWNRRTPAEIERVLCVHGITADTTVVVTGRTGTPDMSQAEPGREAGQIAANRVAALLLWAGVEDVRVLDGGLGAWEAAGYPLETRDVPGEPVRSFGRTVPARPELMIDIGDAQRLLDDDNGALVSVRSWAEFIGEVSGYHYVKPKGRIPGAVFGNCGSDAYHMQNYRNHDNTMRDYRRLEANWRSMGITSDKEVAFYCGTGWRGAEAFMCAWLMGWPRVAVYDGGWFDWSIDEERPLATGVPEELPAPTVGL